RGGGEAGRPRADYGHRLARAHGGRRRGDPALVEGVLDDPHLDLLDGDGIVVDAEDAGALAGRGAEASGELGEVVGGVKPVDRLAPPVAVDEVVPVRNQVAEGTALMTQGDAAVNPAPPPLPDIPHLQHTAH